MDIIIFATLLFLFVCCYSYVTKSVYEAFKCCDLPKWINILASYLWPITIICILILSIIILVSIAILMIATPFLVLFILVDIAYLKLTGKFEDKIEITNN